MSEETTVNRPLPHLRVGGRGPQGPISPELVLVDPELAAWARAQLVADASPVASGTFETTPLSRRVSPPPRWRPTHGSSTAAVCGVTAPVRNGRPGTRGQRRRSALARRSSSALAAAGLLLAAIAFMPGTAADRPILVDANAGRPPAPRTFVWPAAVGARGYAVTLSRGGQAILVERTVEPRLTVAGRWTQGGRSFALTPGRYRWSVRALGANSTAVGKPVVDARLVVDGR